MRRISRCLRAALRVRWLFEAVLEVMRPARKVPEVAARRRVKHAERRARALFLLLRIAAVLRAPLPCRRIAFAVYRALAGTGSPVSLCFGIRMAKPGEPHAGQYVGHVWASRPACPTDPRSSEYPMMVVAPGGEETGWRRG